MLKLLKRIVQEVNSAKDWDKALRIVVQRVKETTKTQACTIYMLDTDNNEYVMMATDGLNATAVGAIRVAVNQGLIGLVGQREEPINLEDAQSHPNFIYEAVVGEDQFKAFLGVPIIHHRNVLGVLVIQQLEQRRFDETEEAFLITLSAQLAGVIAHAKATGMFDAQKKSAKRRPSDDLATLGGLPCVPGVGIGTGLMVYPKADLAAVPDRKIEDIEAEIVFFEEALSATREGIRALSKKLSETLPPEEQALFDAYLSILDRASLGAEVIAEIRQNNWAQGALRLVIERHVKHFSQMEDDYLQERATDLRDLGRRVLANLQAKSNKKKHYPEHTILVGEEVTAADLAEAPEGCLAAVVSANGSSNSHVAILARALGIPTVMAATGQAMSLLDGKELVVDGYYGHVYVSPSKKLRKEFTLLAKEEEQLDADLAALRDLPAKTPDGREVALYVNMGLVLDASVALSVGAAGVGLYRTEVSFMNRESFPVEEEQRVLYSQLLKAFAPRPVIMRTLDIGGDKSLPYFPIEEENPFLGWRGIRITLDHPEIFLVQLRAMLRAGENVNNLQILLPMISGIAELDHALHFIDRAYNELRDENIEIEMPAIGVMVEVPSAVYQIEEIAKRVDFISVGSNDLIQYLLAVDRNNSRVANLYDALHPAVLRSLVQIVEGVHKQSKSVSICGEMASDPAAVILLLAMGFDGMSMNARSLLRIKWVIRNFSLGHARKLLHDVMQIETPAMIRLHLETALDQAGLGGLIRAGKR